MIPVKEAIEIIDKNIIPLEEKEKIDVQFSNGHILFQDVYSPINMPPFRQSAMDGYALLLQNDVTYKIIDEVKAGDNHNPVLKPGEAVRIFTGAAVPNSANAVIMQESVIVENNRLILQKPVAFGENIRPLGEQVKKGGVALSKETKISPAAVGYLTSLGITKVVVFKRIYFC